LETESFSHRLKIYYKTIIPLFEEPKVGGYTMLILSLFTIAFFGAFAIKPTLVTIVQLKKSIEDNTVVDKALAGKINQLRVAYTAYSQIRSELNTIFTSLPNKPETASLVGKLNRLFADNSTNVVSLQFESIDATPPKVASSSAQVLLFTLSGKAPYQNALSFINALSRMDRIVTIDVVTMQSTTGDGAFSPTDAVTFTLRGKAYMLWGNREDAHG
jgi:Tfp pilus assembly protein PilO